jgi:hypothetical protein
MAEPCVSLIPGISELLADKGCDSNAFRKFLKNRRIKPVIPSKSNRKKKIRHDKEAYKSRKCSRALLLQAQGFQAHSNALRQTGQELLLGSLLRRYPCVLAPIRLSPDPSASGSVSHAGRARIAEDAFPGRRFLRPVTE